MADQADSGYEFDMLEAWFPKDIDANEEYERLRAIELEREAND